MFGVGHRSEFNDLSLEIVDLLPDLLAWLDLSILLDLDLQSRLPLLLGYENLISSFVMMELSQSGSWKPNSLPSRISLTSSSAMKYRSESGS